MAIKLVESPLPKSASGRKSTPMNQEVADALVKAFQDAVTIPDAQGGVRPRALGTDDQFDTKGKASAAGRRYALYAAEKIGKKIRVSVYSEIRDKAPFSWRIYVPLADAEAVENSA